MADGFDRRFVSFHSTDDPYFFGFVWVSDFILKLDLFTLKGSGDLIMCAIQIPS